MKNLKKIMAIVMAMVMVLAMSITVFAEEQEPQTPVATPTYDYPLTVTGLSNNDSVKFYKIIEWVGEADNNVAGWKAVSPYDSVLDKDTLKAMLVGTAAVEADPDATPPIEGQEAIPATGMTSQLAGQLAALATSGGVDPDNFSNGTATLNNASSGMWMAIITPADVNTVYNPVFVSADYNKETGHEGTAAVSGQFADAVAKKSTLTLTKTAANENDYNGDDAQTTAVGDVVSFTVNTSIPGYGEIYTHPHFVLKDTLTDLELVTDSVTLTAPTGLKKKGAEGVEDADADYEVTTTTGGYTITFTEKYLKTVKTATDVTVTYNATVTSTAAKAINEEDNEVSIEYSHNPSNQNDYEVKKDTTQHYTFSLDAEGLGQGASETTNGKKTSELVKIGVDAAGNPITQKTEHSEIVGSTNETWTGPLQNAEFGLWKSDDSSCEREPYKTATTGADGRMNFAGLDAGTYYLKEISAPAGFVTNSTIHTVVIAATFDTVTVTEYYKDGVWSSTNSEGAKAATYETQILKSYSVKVDGNDTATYTFTNDIENSINSTDINWEEAEIVEHPFELKNVKGTELPSTGGIGTTIFYIVGSLMVLGAAVVLITKRRIRA